MASPSGYTDLLIGMQATNDILYDGYHSLDDFRAKHQQKFGVPPYVSPPNRTFWYVYSLPLLMSLFNQQPGSLQNQLQKLSGIRG